MGWFVWPCFWPFCVPPPPKPPQPQTLAWRAARQRCRDDCSKGFGMDNYFRDENQVETDEELCRCDNGCNKLFNANMCPKPQPPTQITIENYCNRFEPSSSPPWQGGMCWLKWYPDKWNLVHEDRKKDCASRCAVLINSEYETLCTQGKAASEGAGGDAQRCTVGSVSCATFFAILAAALLIAMVLAGAMKMIVTKQKQRDEGSSAEEQQQQQQEEALLAAAGADNNSHEGDELLFAQL